MFRNIIKTPCLFVGVGIIHELGEEPRTMRGSMDILSPNGLRGSTGDVTCRDVLCDNGCRLSISKPSVVHVFP